MATNQKPILYHLKMLSKKSQSLYQKNLPNPIPKKYTSPDKKCQVMKNFKKFTSPTPQKKIPKQKNKNKNILCSNTI